MSNLQNYSENVDQGHQFLDNHNQLLNSLLLSKQNAGNNPYSETTQGIGNGPVQPGEGIGEAGNGQPA